MIEASNRFANALRGLGIGRGDVLAVHTPQRPETAIAHIACYRPRRDRTADFETLRSRRESNTASRTVQRKSILMEPETAQKMDAIDRKSIPNFKHVITTTERMAA